MNITIWMRYVLMKISWNFQIQNFVYVFCDYKNHDIFDPPESRNRKPYVNMDGRQPNLRQVRKFWIAPPPPATHIFIPRHHIRVHLNSIDRVKILFFEVKMKCWYIYIHFMNTICSNIYYICLMSFQCSNTHINSKTYKHPFASKLVE